MPGRPTSTSPHFGAFIGDQGTRFVVPARARVCSVRLFREDGATHETVSMTGVDAIFAVELQGIGKGARYRFVIDGEEATDPFARFLPDGPDAPATVEALSHHWEHPPRGAPRDLSIYELHVGTFTPEGTYRAASKKLSHVAELGVTAVELMPIASFAGRRGWGYDGVAHYAPFARYGSPEDLAAFVDDAHGAGLSVILDVVYNHFGPAGNWLRRFVPDAFTSRFASPRGEAPMRAYVLGNVRYWLDTFCFDGLRLDATHAIHKAAEIARTIERGSWYCGATYPPKEELRGTATDGLDASAFVHCVQNHDQIGNRPRGDRLTATSGYDAFAAAVLVLLTLPSTPLLFMGQEWGATAPFLYFTDHEGDLGTKITEGRRREFAAFEAFAKEHLRDGIPDPQAESTWAASRLDWSQLERDPHAGLFALHRALLQLRATDPVLRDRSRSRMRAWSEGELLVVDRWSEGGRRRVIANLTSDPLPLADDVVRDATLLLASSPAFLPRPPTELPPRTAALFAPKGARST
jgi:1,4-alpha-glucan branching enzyme